MSLLFERAIAAFAPADADLAAVPDEGDTADAPAGTTDVPGDPLDVGPLAEVAASRADALAHPDRDWACVPLHDPDSAELSGEYVGYEDHPVRGDVFVVAGDDDPEPLPGDEFAASALARRVRFWLPGVVPDERPSYAPDGPLSRVEPTNPMDAGGFFDMLSGFVADEREAERDRNRERAGGHGDGVADLHGFTRTGDGFRVHAPESSVQHEYGVFEDDEVLVRGGGSEVVATVERVAGDAIDLRPIDGDDAALDALGDADDLGLWVLLNPVPYDREAAAVETVRRDDDWRAVLAGDRAATFDHPVGRRTWRLDADLDDAQAFAAAAACYADDVCCIHGPPGTGKTRTLVEVVRRAVAAGERVLVCADSNQAVDNVLVGTSTAGDPDPHSLHYHARDAAFVLARHRADHSDSDLVRAEYRDEPARADVVATTDSSAADFDDREFDLAVVDEATQATPTSTLVPLSKADRAVLAGDHHQLPPFQATETPPDDTCHFSLFEHLYADDGVYGRDVGVLLTTQYRMHSAIAAFSSQQFYDGRLTSGRDVPALDGLPPLLGVDVRGDERHDDTHSFYNDAEADAVERLLGRVTDAGLDPEDVGVITPYEAQVRLLRGRLPDAVTVDTVDSFQGSEREAVVMSFVRSNDDGDVGFLGRQPDGPRRLNVALTRAGRFLGLVGDWDTLRASHRGGTADLYRDLHDHVQERGEMETVDGG